MPFMWISYLVATATSFYHVYRFCKNFFDHEAIAFIAAIGIDIALIAFLKLISEYPKMKETGISMVIFLGMIAFMANAFDAFTGGKDFNSITTDVIYNMDIVTLARFILTGLVAPIVMIISGIVLFAPTLLERQQKAQPQKPNQGGGNNQHQSAQKSKVDTVNF